MNKKILIGIIITIIAILSITGFIILKTTNTNISNSYKFDELDLIDVSLNEEDKKYVEIYWDYIKNSDDSIFNNDFIYEVADINFDKIPDLVIYNGKDFKNCTIEDNKVKMYSVEGATNLKEFQLRYSENENRYYYTIVKQDEEYAFITIDNIEKKANLSAPEEDNVNKFISDEEIIELAKENINPYEVYQKNYILTEFKTYEKNLNKYDFSKTYELASVNTINNEKAKSSTESQNGWNNEYLGDYTWESGKDTIQFELVSRDNEIQYYMLYYPNGYTHASEELWGTWDIIKTNIDKIDNKNQYTSTEYSFNNIKYINGNVEMDIKSSGEKQYKIPDGYYVFNKIKSKEENKEKIKTSNGENDKKEAEDKTKKELKVGNYTLKYGKYVGDDYSLGTDREPSGTATYTINADGTYTFAPTNGEVLSGKYKVVKLRPNQNAIYGLEFSDGGSVGVPANDTLEALAGAGNQFKYQGN